MPPDEEVWLSIPTWHGRYEASNQGRIRSFAGREVRILKPHSAKGGYLNITLSDQGNGRLDTCRVHVLVAITFHGPRPKGLDCAHINGDSLDNRASNLAWKTRAENEADKRRHGTDNSGSRNGNAKLTAGDVAHIREAYQSPRWGLGSELAKKFGVSRTTICQIRSGNRWGWVS